MTAKSIPNQYQHPSVKLLVYAKKTIQKPDVFIEADLVVGPPLGVCTWGVGAQAKTPQGALGTQRVNSRQPRKRGWLRLRPTRGKLEPTWGAAWEATSALIRLRATAFTRPSSER